MSFDGENEEKHLTTAKHPEKEKMEKKKKAGRSLNGSEGRQDSLSAQRSS